VTTPVKPKPGDFGLVSIPGAGGRAIRAAQWLNGDGYANLEHAFLVLDEETLIEAQPGGAVIRPLSEHAGRDVVYSSWPLTDEQRSNIVTHGRLLEGTPYSEADYLALAAHRLHIPAPGLRQYIANSKRLICSQLIALAYDLSGVFLFPHLWEGYVTPGALRRVLTGPA
jgi:hypothetical protein